MMFSLGTYVDSLFYLLWHEVIKIAPIFYPLDERMGSNWYAMIRVQRSPIGKGCLRMCQIRKFHVCLGYVPDSRFTHSLLDIQQLDVSSAVKGWWPKSYTTAALKKDLHCSGLCCFGL